MTKQVDGWAESRGNAPFGLVCQMHLFKSIGDKPAFCLDETSK
jgi:hypothetical protein